MFGCIILLFLSSHIYFSYLYVVHKLYKQLIYPRVKLYLPYTMYIANQM